MTLFRSLSACALAAVILLAPSNVAPSQAAAKPGNTLPDSAPAGRAYVLKGTILDSPATGLICDLRVPFVVTTGSTQWLFTPVSTRVGTLAPLGNTDAAGTYTVRATTSKGAITITGVRGFDPTPPLLTLTGRKACSTTERQRSLAPSAPSTASAPSAGVTAKGVQAYTISGGIDEGTVNGVACDLSKRFTASSPEVSGVITFMPTSSAAGAWTYVAANVGGVPGDGAGTYTITINGTAGTINMRGTGVIHSPLGDYSDSKDEQLTLTARGAC